MTDFFGLLASRLLGGAGYVRPLLAPQYAPSPALGPDAAADGIPEVDGGDGADPFSGPDGPADPPGPPARRPAGPPSPPRGGRGKGPPPVYRPGDLGLDAPPPARNPSKSPPPPAPPSQAGEGRTTGAQTAAGIEAPSAAAPVQRKAVEPPEAAPVVRPAGAVERSGDAILAGPAREDVAATPARSTPPALPAAVAPSMKSPPPPAPPSQAGEGRTTGAQAAAGIEAPSAAAPVQRRTAEPPVVQPAEAVERSGDAPFTASVRDAADASPPRQSPEATVERSSAPVERSADVPLAGPIRGHAAAPTTPPRAQVPSAPAQPPVQRKLAESPESPVGRSGDVPLTAPAREAAAAPTPQRPSERGRRGSDARVDSGAAAPGSPGHCAGRTSGRAAWLSSTGPGPGARSTVPRPPPRNDVPAAPARHAAARRRAARTCPASGPRSSRSLRELGGLPRRCATAPRTSRGTGPEPHATMPLFGRCSVRSRSAGVEMPGSLRPREDAAVTPARSDVPTATVGTQVPPVVMPPAPVDSPIQQKAAESSAIPASAQEDAAAAPTPQRPSEPTAERSSAPSVPASAPLVGAIQRKTGESAEGGAWTAEQTGNRTEPSVVRPALGATGPERVEWSSDACPIREDAAATTAPAGAQVPPVVVPPAPVDSPIQRKVAESSGTVGRRAESVDASAVTQDVEARGPEPHAAMPIVRPALGAEPVGRSGDAPFTASAREDAAVAPAQGAAPTAPVGAPVPPAVMPPAPVGSPIQRKAAESPEAVGRRAEAVDASASEGRQQAIPAATREVEAREPEHGAATPAMPLVRPVLADTPFPASTRENAAAAPTPQRPSGLAAEGSSTPSVPAAALPVGAIQRKAGESEEDVARTAEQTGKQTEPSVVRPALGSTGPERVRGARMPLSPVLLREDAAAAARRPGHRCRPSSCPRTCRPSDSEEGRRVVRDGRRTGGRRCVRSHARHRGTGRSRTRRCRPRPRRCRPPSAGSSVPPAEAAASRPAEPPRWPKVFGTVGTGIRARSRCDPTEGRGVGGGRGPDRRADREADRAFGRTACARCDGSGAGRVERGCPVHRVCAGGCRHAGAGRRPDDSD